MNFIDLKYSQNGSLSVGFFGLGKSNLGVLEYLRRHYANLKITLRSESTPAKIPDYADGIYLEDDAFKNIDEDILFLSPSVRADKGELADAEKRGTILSSDAGLFFERNRNDVYAITGSDGKSTTTYLTARLLNSSYERAVPCGNYGDALSKHLDDPPSTAYSCELSSFQLMNITPHSKRCVITNISENHLNWHKSFDEYIWAKRKILEKSEEIILNFDCKISRGFLSDYKPFALFSTRVDESEMRKCARAKLYATLKNGAIEINGRKILEAQKIRVAGEHNIANFMSAILLSYGKYSIGDVEGLAEEFTGLEHRCETVGIISGIKYINSSIDSSPKRTVQTLKMQNDRVVLILGGRSKGLDYSTLLPVLKEKTRAIILMGENWPTIYKILAADKDFGKNGIPFYVVKDLRDATHTAGKIANDGDTVLLSPASVSYDEFTSFEERGRAFKKYVKENQRTN